MHHCRQSIMLPHFDVQFPIVIGYVKLHRCQLINDRYALQDIVYFTWKKLMAPSKEPIARREAYSHIAYGKLSARLFNYLISWVRVMVEVWCFG